MFTFNGRDAHRQLTPSRIHLPFHRAIGEILPDRVKTEDDEVRRFSYFQYLTATDRVLQADPALQRLPAPGLRGTWARAYALLTRLVAQIGWDELLKTRSSVFVMEEEYRMQKAQGDFAGHARTESEVSVSAEGTTLAEHGDEEDNASTRGMVSPGGSAVSAATSPISEVNGNGNVVSENGIPTIRISTEEDLNKEDGAKTATAADTLEKPVQAAAGDDETDGNVTGVEHKGKEPASPATQEPFSFSNKRLCERWLDNLFMVLYEVSVFLLLQSGERVTDRPLRT